MVGLGRLQGVGECPGHNLSQSAFLPSFSYLYCLSKAGGSWKTVPQWHGGCPDFPLQVDECRMDHFLLQKLAFFLFQVLADSVSN